MVYECENCDKVYKTKDCLRVHIKLKHVAIELLQCAKCDKHTTSVILFVGFVFIHDVGK